MMTSLLKWVRVHHVSAMTLRHWDIPLSLRLHQRAAEVGPFKGVIMLGILAFLTAESHNTRQPNGW
jgi:hypothetical protein